MAITRIITPSITDDAIDNTKLDLGDDYTFTGTVEGAGGGIFESQLLHIRDEKAQGTDGGGSGNAVLTRDLNTVKVNEITGASLSSNQITLPSGTYYVEGVTATFASGETQLYLYNVTDTSFEVNGISHHSQSPVMSGRFTISAQKVFEIRYNSSNGESTGRGRNSNESTEVYTDVKIWKVA
jgi:hypothetical protein